MDDPILPPSRKRSRTTASTTLSNTAVAEMPTDPLHTPWFQFGAKLVDRKLSELTESLTQQNIEVLKNAQPEDQELDSIQQSSLLATTGYPFGLPGGVLLRQMRRTLAMFDKTREMHQAMFHEAFLQAMAEGLYGDEFMTEYGNILRANNWKSASVGTIIRCPRQVGKTTAVCMFLAAVMHTIPGYKIIVMSTGSRVSIKLKKDTIDWFKTLSKNAGDRITVNNDENFCVRGVGQFNNVIAEMRALPSSGTIDCGPLISFFKYKSRLVSFLK